jgi:UDP-glucuronate decarboxylase
MESKKILVTGGAGFLGSNLCRELLAQNHTVFCLDNFYTGRKQNLTKLINNPNFKIIEKDVCEPFSVEVDAIYHLACPASPVHYQKNPIKTNKTSVLGMLNALDLAKDLNVPLLYTSTSEVYGDPLEHPQKETYWGNVNPIGIRACYDEGKRCAEAFCMDYHRQHQVDIRIARIFNTYGPNMCPNDGRIISNFIMQALQNQDITLYGDGQQTRSFCFVDDTLSGLQKLMNTQAVHQPVNIGNPIEFTVKDIAEKIIQMTNSHSKLTYLPLPKDDPKKRKPDISRATEILDWTPKVTLEAGLEKAITYFRRCLETKTPETNAVV